MRAHCDLIARSNNITNDYENVALNPPKKGFYSILIVIYVRRMFVQYVFSRIATVLTAHTPTPTTAR